jgi:hypothetical protein
VEATKAYRQTGGEEQQRKQREELGKRRGNEHERFQLIEMISYSNCWLPFREMNTAK